MKVTKLFLASVFCLFFSATSNAQFVDKMAKAAKRKVEREAEYRTERRINRGIDKVFDKTEEGIDNTVRGGDKNSKTKSGSKDEKPQNSKSKNTPVAKDDDARTARGGTVQSSENEDDQVADEETTNNRQQPQSVLTWSKYDFVPGTEIIFEDNQEGEQNGEFPSKWDLVSGVVENANFNGENVIYFIETGNPPNGIVPLLKESSADYLPEEFTVEFDAYFEKEKTSNYYIYFYDAKNKSHKKLKDYLWLSVNRAKYGQIEKQLENTKFATKDNESSHWRHIAVSFNKRAMKVYMDETRLLNIPNITDNPTGITITVNHARQTDNEFIKNVRIAKGAVPLYDKVLTDGKFVTTGIKFDVNKATIKPESAGTINYVFKMMQDNPDLRFSVEGHTDSDGSDAANQTLSEKRAEAVRAELIKLGISADRLTSKGWGESKPMTGNDTPEGKAQNRRVEFVKL